MNISCKPIQLQLEKFSKIGDRKKTVKSELEAITYLAPQLWLILPEEIRSIKSLIKFKNFIKHWLYSQCTCRLCETCMQHVGFVKHVLAIKIPKEDMLMWTLHMISQDSSYCRLTNSTVSGSLQVCFCYLDFYFTDFF